MTRRKPPRRVSPVRSRNNEKRRLCAVPPPKEMQNNLAAKATYGCYAKHKLSPTAYGLAPYEGSDEDRTFCDGHSSFGPQDVDRIPILLRRGILAGLWADYSTESDPRMLWTVDDTGWIYELRITNIGQSQYHGYPLLPSDAFTRKVIDRFLSWASSLTEDQINSDFGLKQALVALQDRYR